MSTSSGSMTLDPDLALIRTFQAGGPGADASFAELVDRHAPRIRRRAARILGDEGDAEDIVQDVFLNVHRFLDRYRPDRPFAHWLAVVTLNACRIELRRRGARDRRHDAYRRDPARDLLATQAGDPLLRDWLNRALDDMPSLTRECILMRALDGLAYREIGERCGTSEAAAKMRVLRGLKELRERYAVEAAKHEQAA